ncbi:hypothetical protein [Sphingomonas sp. M1-B02]|uniref:hypothetical protein n=1 Tax=Sphingomonas sp. M1-B02 TaxID=3114300 RepID=UPI00223FE394|nr:hypothetical protein [Sphingomonas sp. S6-11]UZK66581.1 hypothetical protein OKW87_01700 [Sphingomonas sp. S6-11]
MRAIKAEEWDTWFDGTTEEVKVLVRPYDGPMDVQLRRRASSHINQLCQAID